MMSKSLNQGTQQAKLFVPYPDGQALLYELKGTANEPPVEGTLDFTIDTKKTEVLKIPITNWLAQKQCFSVSWQLKNQDPSVVIKGGDAIDLNGKETKDYKVNLLTYNEGACSFTVTFENSVTKEYMFFDVNVTSKKREVFDQLDFKGPLREVVSKLITVENPTSVQATFNAADHKLAANQLLWLNPATFNIAPGKSIGIQIN